MWTDARGAGVSADGPPLAVRLARLALGLALGLALPAGSAWAMLPQVNNLRFRDAGTLAWDSLPGSAGYNIYKGDLAGLRSGKYGGCLLGSLQGVSVSPPGDAIPVGTGVFFLVDGFDETGEGQVADSPLGNPSPRCVAARRVFALTADGDPGDGITDGSQPLLNSSALLYATHRETDGVYLQSGEFTLFAADLMIPGRSGGGWYEHRFVPGYDRTGVAIYGNSPDLTLGRELRTAQDDALEGLRYRNTVVISYRPFPSGSTRVGQTERLRRINELSILTPLHDGVSFYAYSDLDPSDRKDYAGLDFSGPRFNPGICTNCHGGTYQAARVGGSRYVPSGWQDQPEVYRKVITTYCVGCHNAFHSGASMALSKAYRVTRTYRSQIRYNGPLGQGWDFPANARVVPSGSNLSYFDGTGRQETYVRLDAAHFAPTPGRYAQLVQNGDGSFTLRDRDGSVQNFHAFDGSNRQGVLESTQNRQGDRAAFLYDNQGLLTTVVDPLGRAIAYAYGPDGRVASITDFAGRSVVYSYDSAGNLITVRSPIVTGTPNGNDFPNGRTTTYAYSSGFADPRLNNNLIAVIRPDESASGVPAVQNVYGSDPAAFTFDRVVSQTIGGTNGSGVPAGGSLTYAYQSLNPGADPANLTLPRRQATVLDRNGNQRQYIHNVNGNCLSRADFTNRNLRPGEPDYTTQYAYDSDGELITVVRPQGDRTQLVYDKPGADRYREGNLILVRSVADSLGSGGRGDGHGGESNDLVSTFTYEPIFNQVASATEPRGNDPTYVPQNGGPNSPGRYTRSWLFDYQEGDPALNGINAYVARFSIDTGGLSFGLGDLNGDGVTTQAEGNAVKVVDPTVHLDPASQQAAITGGTLQTITSLFEWNGHGQMMALTDAEQNRHTFQYYPETDPDGDGVPTPPPPDGRFLDPATGGYLKTRLIDTAMAPGRDNGLDPGPISIQYDMQYDPVGDLTELIDGRGVATRFIYNALNELVETHRAAATADVAGPDGTPATGRGETGLMPFGFLLRYAYDADGNVLSEQQEDRGGTRGIGPFVTRSFTYDILGDPVQVQQPATSSMTLTTKYGYDANQNLVRLTEPDGNSAARAYDERDLLLSSTRGADGPLGGTPSTRHYDYDGDGDLARVTDGRGSLLDYLYDGHDRVARTVDAVGGTQDPFYDPASDYVRLLGRGTPGGPTPTDRSGSGNVDLTDVRLYYDEMLRRYRDDRMLFMPAGVVPARPPMLTEGSLLPGDGAINGLYEYDRLSRLTFVHQDSGALTRVDYDGAGRAVRTTNPAGDPLDRTFDAGSDLVETVERESPTQPGPVSEQFLTTLYYDALGRQTMLVDNLGETSRSFYDSLDALTLSTDANGPPGGSITRRSPGFTGLSVAINGNGNVTRYAYDAAGRPLSSVQVLTASGKGDGTTSPPPDNSNAANPDGLITLTTSWTGDSLPAQSLDDKGNPTTYAYDNLNRTVFVGRSDGFAQQVSLDPEDNVVSRTDPNGTQVTNSYDLASRLTMMQAAPLPGGGVAGTTLRTYEYDGRSRLTRSFDNNNPSDSSDDAAVAFLYDSLGRPIEEAQMPPPGAGAARYSDLGWQAAGLLISLTYPSGDQVMYGYDGADRLRTAHDLQHPELMATFDYFGLSRLSTRMSGNGVRMTFLDDSGTLDTGYDGLGRPMRLRHLDPTNTLLAGFDYRYDRVSNRTAARRLHDTDASGNARGNVYVYDSANRLVSSQEAYLDPGFTIASPLFDSEAWTLDGPGNWANLTRNGTLYLNRPNNLNEYDEPQCCGTHSEDGLKDDFLDAASTPAADGLNLTYDKNGNQTDTVLQTLDFNFANQPVATRNLSTGAAVSAYAYDALGRRTRRQVTGGAGSTGTTTFDYVADLFAGAVEEDDALGSLVRQLGYGPGGQHLWQLQAAGTSQYLLEDALGSTAALIPGLSAGGPPTVLERVVYDPYGKPTFENALNQPLKDLFSRFIPESPNRNAYLFAGMRYDPELGARSASVNSDFGGLYANGGYYNPNEGRPMYAGLYAGFPAPVENHREFDNPTSYVDGPLSPGRPSGGWFEWRFIPQAGASLGLGKQGVLYVHGGHVSSGRATGRKGAWTGSHDANVRFCGRFGEAPCTDLDPAIAYAEGSGPQAPCPWCTPVWSTSAPTVP